MRNLELLNRFILLTIVALLSLECYQTGDLKKYSEEDDIQDIPASGDADTDTDSDTDSDTRCVVNGGIWLVEQVEDWVGQVDGSATIYLESGEELHIQAGQRLREAWFIWIENSLEDGDLVAFHISLPDATVLDVDHPWEYTVDWVENDPKEDHVEIAFHPSHAIHSLYRDHPCFDRFLALIEEGSETDEPLLITEAYDEENGDLRGIVDVRRP